MNVKTNVGSYLFNAIGCYHMISSINYSIEPM